MLIGIYYGLIVYRYCTRKKRSTDVQSNPIILPSRPNVYFSSCLIFFVVLILATVALLIKWSLIQPIHDEIVDKYRHKRPLFYESNSFCQVISYQKFNLITFPLSCVLILAFAIECKRISFKTHYLDGRFAPPVPVDFLSHINRKLVAVIFAICANQLLEIVNDTFMGSSSTDQGVVLVYLQQIVQVLVVGFRYYPILSAVYIDSLLSIALGTLYTWIEFTMTIVEQGLCQPRFYSDGRVTNMTTTEQLLDYYGTGSFLVVMELCADIPRYLCLSYICIRLTKTLYRKVRYRSVVSLELADLNQEEKSLLSVVQDNSVEMRYVRNLFRSKRKNVAQRWFYEWRNDFHFSSRVLSVYSSIFLLLYLFLIQICVQLLPYLKLLEELIQSFIDVSSSQHSVPLLIRPFLCSVIIGTMITVGQLLLLLAGIRRNLFQVYRGDDSEIPRRDRSQYENYAVGNFHFAGYLIGYLLWGLLLIVFGLFVLSLVIYALFIFQARRAIEEILKFLIPILLFIYFKQYLNKCLARFVFLQDAGDVLAVNNRRALMIFLYFNFFLDAFLGFLSSIIRLVLSALGGIVYMCRLDYSPLGRKLETWDSGYSSYCGFIHTECTHRHPILLVFAGHLLDLSKKKHKSSSTISILNKCESLSLHKDEETRQRSCRIRRKWQMTVFLVRNPSIVFFRKAYFNQFHLDEPRVFLKSISRVSSN